MAMSSPRHVPMLTARTVLTTLDDAERLMSWVAPNTAALRDPAVEGLVLAALAPRPGEDFIMGSPTARHADTNTEPVHLTSFYVQGLPRRTPGRCQRNARHGAPADHRLIVPCSGSVVEVYVCTGCRLELNDLTGLALLWR